MIQEFLTLEWNVLSALAAGDRQILDCFSSRVAHREWMSERLNVRNTHYWDVVRPATTTVRDPTDLNQLQGRSTACSGTWRRTARASSSSTR